MSVVSVVLDKPGKIMDMTPKQYRLFKRKNGELVLQGCYCWSQGNEHGFEWRDLPTIEESITTNVQEGQTE